MNGDAAPPPLPPREPRSPLARARDWLVRAQAFVHERARAYSLPNRLEPPPPPVLRRQILIAGVGLGVLTFVLWERCGVRGCPNVERLASYQPGGASVLLDREGRVFADLAPVQREVVELESLPERVPQAFVAVEDKRFYEHNGVDARRFVGALLANIRARGVSEGFSTITMQLARNVFPDRLPGQQRTPKRKLLEVRVAREIEEKFEKDEILELYLNHIYFGGGAYGIEAAARHYYGKSARNLTLSQAATLAAMVKGPSYYDPRRRPTRTRERRNVVLRLMHEQGLIGDDAARSARNARLGVRASPPAERDRDHGFAPYFADAVRRVLEDRFGEEIYTTKLRVYTTLDRDAQRAAEEELRRQLRAIENGQYGRFGGARYRSTAEAEDAQDFLQGAAVVMRADSGDVLALVGGRDYAQSRFDRATRARRQAGSVFKPFVFAVALSEGYFPTQRLADEPFRMELEGGEVWEPKNFFGEYEGKLTLRESLVRSKNVPTVRLSEAVGRGSVARFARRAGVRSEIPDQPSMALGVASVSPLELASAYTAFARLGTTVEPRYVLRVEDEEENVVWQSEPERERVLDRRVAYILTDLLREAVDRGTGTAVRNAGFRAPAAGKTGTTDEGADVWFVGYTPRHVASVWIGFDQPREIVERASGGRLAAPVWGRIMRRVQDSDRAKTWTRPSGVIERRVDPSTGLVLAEGCRPKSGRADRELFVAGDEPAETCPRGRPPEEAPGFFDRVLARARMILNRTSEWLASHFGREELVPPASARDRYLGAPRLPRVEDVPIPEVDPDLYEPPTLEERIVVPEIEPLTIETTTVEVLDTVTLDTLPPPLAPPRDTARRDTAATRRPPPARRDST